MLFAIIPDLARSFVFCMELHDVLLFPLIGESIDEVRDVGNFPSVEIVFLSIESVRKNTYSQLRKRERENKDFLFSVLLIIFFLKLKIIILCTFARRLKCVWEP